MAIRDRALKALRRVFGDERDAREQAESPSADALRHAPSSTYAIWGREDIGGLLSVSQNLMDRYADYEAMNDYPDIRCFTGDMKVYVADDRNVIVPLTISELAASNSGYDILAYDVKKKMIKKVAAEQPRISGRNALILRLQLSNGETLRVTPCHKILTVEPGGYIEAKDLRKGAFLVGARGGFELNGKSMLTVNQAGGVWLKEDPIPDGYVKEVYDITTSTHNLLVNGVICHNSAFHYFANDATQPNMDNGRVAWVQSPDQVIVDSADTLIKRRLRLEDDLFSIAYTLCQYGNDYEEVLVTENGVVGLNNLSAPTMRRVEKLNGSLIGYVQDVTGRFTANQDELRRMLAGSMTIPKHVALFEDWQTCHFRLRSTTRRSPYGVSVGEGARWIWKRLVMLEDAVMIYKLCLRGDSQIWTPEGRKAIKDLKEGDGVYSFTTADKLKKTKVVYKKHNGQDKIFRVFSDHREIFANKTHPVLVETVIGQGSGKPRIRRLDYVEVQNLKPGVHRLVTPKKNAEDWEEIRLKTPKLHSKARLGSPERIERKLSYPKIAKEVGVHHYRARDFFESNYELKTETAVALLDANGYGPDLLEIEDHWGGERGLSVKGVTIPETVTEEFARWWGFMLGDGFITTREHKKREGRAKGYTAQNEVGFALGADDQLNAYYKDLFERWVTETKHVGDGDDRLGAYSFVSSKFAEFMCLNGFIPGAHHKRLPEWIFRAHPSLKLAMIRGLADADAHVKPRNVSEVRGRVRHEVFRFEMCNEALLKDVRELAMQLGLVVTFVGSRFREGGRIIKGGKPLPDGTYYTLDVSIKDQPLTEMLRGVEEIETDDIWDIGVEAEEHNFVTDGVVTHNTRSPARYAFYVDVTDVPPNRVESFLKRAKRDLKKKKMVNPNNNFLDMRYNPLCLSGETKIPLLDGSEKTLLEMVGAHERGEEQWVYSVDVNDGNKLVPGKVTWAGGTRKNAQLVKITLDNGESIKVTPDHKMIRRSGEKAEAQTLKVGDSLMPYYRKRGNVSPAAPDYEMVYDPSDHTYKFAHRIVAESLGIWTNTTDTVIHHEDCNRLNNDPRNLTEMTWADHKALHHRLSRAAAEKLIAYNQTDKARAETAATNREYDKPALMREAITPEIREKQKKAARASKKAFWADSKKKAQASKKMRYAYPDTFINAIFELIEKHPKAGAATIARLANEADLIELLREANPGKAAKLKNIHRDMLRWMCHSLGFKNFKEFKSVAPLAIPHNHKVAKIEWLDEAEDTYTLTVDTAHTFATSCGVMVCNSNDEDFFIAVRDGRALSRVEVLSGPDYQCLTADTQIPLLDGSSPTIKELADRGGEHWVYSCTESGRVVPGRGHSVRMSSPDAEIWEVELDNGEAIECTWQHPFLTRDGRWVFAKDLQPGDSLMPLYRRITSKKDGDRLDGYEKIYNPSTDSWSYTHQLVYDDINEDKGWIKGTVIHHENGKLDNRPDRIRRVTRSEHSALHEENVKRLHTPEVAEKRRQVKQTTEHRQKMSDAWHNSPEERRVAHRRRMKRRMSQESEREKHAKLLSAWNCSEDHKRRIRREANVNWRGDVISIDDLVRIVDLTGTRTMRQMMALGKVSQSVIQRVLHDDGVTWATFASKHIPGWRAKGRAKCKMTPAYLKEKTEKEAAIPGNHKVVAVRKTGRREPVYDITVEGTHCFAVGQGVFVHNTTDDVEYFQRKLHGALMVPRAYMGQDAPIQGRAILCLTGDTKVPLLDGRTRSLKELAAEYGPGDAFHVYSVGDNGKVTVGRAHSPQVTRPNAEIWEVTLDNGKTVRGTPDHPFMMRDGSYRRLDELSAGDSLMPLYRRDSTKSRDGMGGYDQYLDPKTGKWRFTHRMAASWKWNRLLKHEGRVIHHEDFDKRNNDPRNLADPLAEEHLQIHRDHADKTIGRPEVRAKATENSKWWTQSEECADLCRENLEKARQPGGGQHEWCVSDDHRALKSEQMKKQWAKPKSKLRARTQTDEFRNSSSEKMKESIALGKIKVCGEDNTKWRHDASYARLVDAATSYRCVTIHDLVRWTDYSTCLISRILKDEGTTFREFAEQYLVYGFDPGGHKKRRAQKAAIAQCEELSASGVPGNHKVVSVRKLAEREDCYDFVVDGTHNYALDAGIFVHNSNEDVRAARVSLQIQKELKNGIERLIRIDLAARKHPNPWAAELEVMMTVPSNIYELAAMEVKNARADFAARIQPYVSMHWLLENVFKLTDDEIRVIEKQRQREANLADSMGMDPSFSAFTGGRPPEVPPEGAAPPGGDQGVEELPGGGGGYEEVPGGGGYEEVPGGGGVEELPGSGGLEEVPPSKGAPITAWKDYDRRNRLEEQRNRESRRNHQKLVDMIGNLQQNDAAFARRLDETSSFLQEFKKAALRRADGRLMAIPSAAGFKNHRGNGH